MRDRRNLRAEHQALLRNLVQETGMALSAIAGEIGVAPSTLNKVNDGGDKHTHVLSSPTLALLEDFRAKRRLGSINAQVESDLSKEAESQQLLKIWFEMDRGVRNAALILLEAASRSQAGKVG